MERKIKAIKRERIDDFIKLYKVFRDPPYNEDWTDEAMVAEYDDLSSTGFVCGYYIDDVCVGLITFRPFRLDDRHPVLYDEQDRVAYLSDITVLSEYRNKGIGTTLMRYCFTVLKKENFATVYMKTLAKGSMSYGIAIKLGFEKLDVTSVDTRNRTVEGRDVDDVKIYLEKKL